MPLENSIRMKMVKYNAVLANFISCLQYRFGIQSSSLMCVDLLQWFKNNGHFTDTIPSDQITTYLVSLVTYNTMLANFISWLKSIDLDSSSLMAVDLSQFPIQ